MSSQRSPAFDYPLEISSDEEQKPVNTLVPANPDALKNWNQFKEGMIEDLKVNLCDAGAVTFGTGGWMVAYYLPLEGKSGYVAKCLAEGVISNGVATPFIYLGRRIEGEDHEKALRSTFKYFLQYIPIDSAYQPLTDAAIALTVGTFEMVAEPTGQLRERLYVAGFFVATIGNYYYLTERLEGIDSKKRSAWNAALVVAAYCLFHSLDVWFKVDYEWNDELNTGQNINSYCETILPNVLYSCLIMGAFTFVTDMLTDLAVRGYHYNTPEELEEKVVSPTETAGGHYALVGDAADANSVNDSSDEEGSVPSPPGYFDGIKNAISHTFFGSSSADDSREDLETEMGKKLLDQEQRSISLANN